MRAVDLISAWSSEAFRLRLAKVISSRRGVRADIDGGVITLRLLSRWLRSPIRGRLRLEVMDVEGGTRVVCTPLLHGAVLAFPTFTALFASIFPVVAIALHLTKGEQIPSEVWSFGGLILVMGGWLYAMLLAVALAEQHALIRFVKDAIPAHRAQRSPR